MFPPSFQPPLLLRIVRPAVWIAALALLIPDRSVLANPALPPPGIAFEQRLGEEIPLDLPFVDDAGRPVRIGDYFGGKPVVLVPVYYKCPMLCGLELNALVRCLRVLKESAGREFQIVTFSIDPREQPPLAAQKRKQYLAQYGRAGSEPGWRFLTGEQESIDALCETIGFQTVYDPHTGQYAHAAGIVVCTPTGTISRYLLGVEFAPRELKLALLESSKGLVGSLSDHILMFCFAYDPTRGRYGLAILNLLRAAGVLTVLAMAVGIGGMLRQERLRAQKSLVEGDLHG